MPETVEIHSTIDAVAPEWDALVDAVRGSPFLRPGWFSCWSDAFGGGSLEIVAMRRNDRLVAVAPLHRFARGCRSLTNWHSVDSGLIAVDAAALRSLAEGLLARARDRLALSFLDSAGPELSALTAAAAHARRASLSRAIQRSPYLEIDGDWERYEQGLSKNVRNDVRRRRRRLDEQGAVEIEVVLGGAVDDALTAGFEIEGSGWKAERGTAIASRPETRRFYTEIAHWAAAHGWLHMAFLRLDGRPLAFQLNLEAEGVHYHLKGGFAPERERLSPGKVLHHAMLEDAFRRGVSRYEFLGDEDAYKMQWANAVHEKMAFEAFSRTPTGLGGYMTQRYGRPLARYVLQSARRLRR